LNPLTLPNALIRAFEGHFIYEREIKGHLRHIPPFIQKAIDDICPEYEGGSILKRFTGYLLGYLIQKNQTDFFIFIPCSKEERKAIAFLLRDCLHNRKLQASGISIKLSMIFIGEEVYPYNKETTKI
jgi:hypothetical protein